jgi:hypothetical protein
MSAIPTQKMNEVLKEPADENLLHCFGSPKMRFRTHSSKVMRAS